MEIESPYIDTKLYTNVTLYPNQMTNNVYLNLKANLVEELNRKCFGDYGYIAKIYEILSYDNNRIEAENTMSAGVYDVCFSCRLCRPIKNTVIICEIEKINKALMRVVNGPIKIFITHERINPNIFFKDNNGNLRYMSKDRSYLLKQHEFVRIRVIQTTFNSGENVINALGFLDNMATDDDIKSYYNDQYLEKDQHLEKNEVDKDLDIVEGNIEENEDN